MAPQGKRWAALRGRERLPAALLACQGFQQISMLGCCLRSMLARKAHRAGCIFWFCLRNSQLKRERPERCKNPMHWGFACTQGPQGWLRGDTKLRPCYGSCSLPRSRHSNIKLWESLPPRGRARSNAGTQAAALCRATCRATAGRLASVCWDPPLPSWQQESLLGSFLPPTSHRVESSL